MERELKVGVRGWGLGVGVGELVADISFQNKTTIVHQYRACGRCPL